jgi:hypothetical protein
MPGTADLRKIDCRFIRSGTWPFGAIAATFDVRISDTLPISGMSICVLIVS